MLKMMMGKGENISTQTQNEDRALRQFAQGCYVIFLALYIESSSLVVTVLRIVVNNRLSAWVSFELCGAWHDLYVSHETLSHAHSNAKNLNRLTDSL
jgi:hypothetical protein